MTDSALNDIVNQAADDLRNAIRDAGLEPYVIAVIGTVDREPDNPGGDVDSSLAASGPGGAIVHVIAEALARAGEKTGRSVAILNVDGPIGGQG